MTAITTSATHGPWYLTDNGRDPVFITDEHGEQVSLAELNARFFMLKRTVAELQEVIDTDSDVIELRERIKELERANTQLFAHGEKMYAQLAKTPTDAELSQAYQQGYADGRKSIQS